MHSLHRHQKSNNLDVQEVVMNLRSATSADLTLLRHWDEQPHVVASNPNDKWDWEVELKHNFSRCKLSVDERGENCSRVTNANKNRLRLFLGFLCIRDTLV